MRKIIIIGTLHSYTPSNELKEILEKYKPNQLLVEITQENINKNNFKSYPEEMVFAYGWAIKNKIKVNGFDSTINVFMEGKTEEANQIAEKRNLPPGNILHCIISRDRHFKELNDISKSYKPEEII